MITPQYTYDNSGKKIGVFLPIEDWNQIKEIPAVSELSQPDNLVPEWQIELGKKELQNISEGTADLLDWNEAKKQFKL
jgi:hypothetical protein